MKYSEQPTDWLAINVSCSDDFYTNPDIVLVRLTEAWINQLLERAALMTGLKQVSSLYQMVYWESPDMWVVLDSESDDQEEIKAKLEEDNACFVTVENDDVRGYLSEPEERIDAETIAIDSFGDFKFKGSGKHSGIPVWTKCVGISWLAEEFKKTLAPCTNQQ